jgi:methyltransferase (TIGR00027 family)
MVFVAMEQYLPERERIVTDDLAYPILPLGSRAQVRLFGPFTNWIIKQSEQKVPGLWGGILARKAYIDDQVSEAVDSRIEAVVNLGAGFDTRPYRLQALTDVPVWEVDLPQNIDAKRPRLEKLFQQVPEHVTLVSIDFDHQDLATVLGSHGYEPGRQTFYIWEGVTQYVTEDGVRATFDFLARAPSGSRLVFTYTPRDFIEGKVLYGQEYLHTQMLAKDKIWVFGLDPEQIDGFIGEYGWRVLEHLGYDELDRRFVKPTGRDLQSMAVERVVLAEKL